MATEETWRLFFAVEFPAEARGRAFEVGRLLARDLGQVVKWVEVGSLHVTLKFVGGVPAGRVAEVIEAGRAAAAAGREGELFLAGAGAFPSARRPRVLWIGVSGDIEPLGAVAADLDRRLAEARLAEPEGRPFRPHLTLGRARQDARPPDMAAALAELADAEVGRVWVEDFVLMRSHLSPRGPTYEVVERFPLPTGQAAGPLLEPGQGGV